MTKLGVHIAKVSNVLPNPYKNRKTMFEAIQIDTKKFQLNCCQIFVSGPRSTKMNPMDYDAINKYCKINKINLYVHSNYMSVGIFNVNSGNKGTPKSKNSIKTIISQMESCDELGADGFVIHLSKKTPESIIETLKILYPIIKNFNTPLLLESPAKKPDNNLTYETPKKINNLTNLILKNIPKLKWGWVFDTAHLYSAGIEMNKFHVVKKWLCALKHTKYIKLFHLNGMSLDQFNTGKDIHQVIFGDDDDIWNADCHIDDCTSINALKKSSIYLLTQFAKKNDIDCICEINRGSYIQIKFSIETLHKLFN
jgi:endonuclease IV